MNMCWYVYVFDWDGCNSLQNERMNDRQLYVNFKTVDHLHIRDVAVASKWERKKISCVMPFDAVGRRLPTVPVIPGWAVWGVDAHQWKSKMADEHELRGPLSIFPGKYVTLLSPNWGRKGTARIALWMWRQSWVWKQCRDSAGWSTWCTEGRSGANLILFRPRSDRAWGRIHRNWWAGFAIAAALPKSS